MNAFPLSRVLEHSGLGHERLPDSPLRVYGLFDADRCEGLKAALQSMPPKSCRTLFSDKATAQFMQDVAPYLVELTQDQAEIEKVLRTCSEDAVLFLWSQRPFLELLKALTVLFEIRSAESEPGYLQFYRAENFHEIMKSRSPLVQRLFDVADTYFCKDEWQVGHWQKYSLSKGSVCQELINEGAAS